MAQLITRPLTILHESQTTQGTAHITEFTPRDRMLRGLKTWLGFTATGAVAVFIPIAHFILVPTLVISGIVFGIKQLRAASIYTRADGQCPKCQQAFEMELEAAQDFPKWTYCPHCRASLKLSEYT